MLMWVTLTCIVQQVLEKPDKEWYTQVIDIFRWTSHWASYMSLDLHYDVIPWELNAQKVVY